MAVVIAHLRSRHSHTQTAAESPPPGPSAERESGSCLLLCAGLPECPGDAVRRSPLRASVPPWGERRSARGRRALPLPQRSLAPTLLSPHAATAPSTGSLASRRTRRGLPSPVLQRPTTTSDARQSTARGTVRRPTAPRRTR